LSGSLVWTYGKVPIMTRIITITLLGNLRWNWKELNALARLSVWLAGKTLLVVSNSFANPLDPSYNSDG